MKRLAHLASVFAVIFLMTARGGAQLAPNLDLSPPPPQNVAFQQNVGQMVPLDTTFKDESGKTVTLRDYFGKKPVVLSFAYFTCPMLCGLSMSGLAGSLKGMNLNVGEDFDVLTISFDPRDTPEAARAKKSNAISRYGRAHAAEGWHFLTGDEASIKSITDAAGFRYEWDAAAQQYAHATGIVVLTPEGKIGRYLFGVEYRPKDLRFSLVEASAGKVGTVVDQLLLLCYHYDPKAGKYGPVAIGAMRAGGALTLASLGVFFIVARRGGRTHKKTRATSREEDN